MANNIVCCKNTMNIFRIYQVYPSQGKELNPDIWYFVKFLITNLLASSLSVGCILHFFHITESHNQIYLYKDIAYVLSMLTGYSFFIMFPLNLRPATKLFKFLTDFETFGKPPMFDQRNEELNKLSKYHYVYINLASFSFLLVTNLFTPGQCRKDNEEFNLHEICGLVTNAWLPFDIDYSPVKQIFTALQMFSIFYVYVTAGTVTWFIMEIVEHISVRIDHIKKLFVGALNQEDPMKMEKGFRFAVKYHSRVLELEGYFNNCFSISMFCMMVLAAAVLGCAAFGYMQAGSSSLLVMCVAWFNALSLVCIGAQRLINENVSIAEVIYQTKWYNAEPRLKKDIMFVLMRCQRPMKLRAAAFGVMNHAMIVTVSRAAYSYISLLRASS